MPRRRKKEVDAQIDQSLRRAFDGLAQEPLPDRFTDLLERLKSGDRSSNEDGEPGGNEDAPKE